MEPKSTKEFVKQYRPKIRSRHPSHAPLRNLLPSMEFPSVIRLGSTTELFDEATRQGLRVELNSIQGVKQSSDKSLMKRKFDDYGVVSAKYFIPKDNDIVITDTCVYSKTDERDISYPLICKHFFGSRNTGNHLISSKEEMENFVKNKCLTEYVIEKYHTYTREYRIHIMNGKAIYSCRKMLKNDTPKDKRWFRNDSNSVWITEYVEVFDKNGTFVEFSNIDKPEFDKPVNWDDIVKQAVLAIESVGLDFGAVDLKVEGAYDKEGNKKIRCSFIIIETNSAPALGEYTLKMYLQHLPNALIAKNKQYKNSKLFVKVSLSKSIYDEAIRNLHNEPAPDDIRMDINSIPPIPTPPTIEETEGNLVPPSVTFSDAELREIHHSINSMLHSHLSTRTSS